MAKARRLAKEAKLREIIFLDKWNRSGARGNQVVWVHLRFDNGEEVKLTPREMVMLRDVEFKLQPANAL